MLENIRLSFQGIWAHKMRSLLTMLGIIIGIAAIIAIVSTIKGTSEQIKENLVGSGNNIVNVKLYQGEWTYTSGDSSTPENMPMVTDDIKNEILAVDEVTAVASYRYGALYEGINSGTKDLGNAPVYGVDKDYFRVMGYTVQTGRLFEDQDWTNYTKGVILDTVAANTLFASENPIGKTLEIKGEPFIIVGVVEQIDGFTPKVTNMNDWYTYYGNTSSGQVFITDVNWPLIFSFDEPYNLVVKPAGTDAMTNAGKKTADIMNSYMPATSSENVSVACAASYAQIGEIIDQKLPENADKIGAYFREELLKLPCVKEVRGRGLMIGVEFNKDIATDVKYQSADEGLLITAVRPNVIRLVPPLNITEKECDEAFAILHKVVSKLV